MADVGVTPSPGSGIRDVNTPVGADPTRYQETFELTLPLGSVASAIAVDSASAVFQATFSPLDFDVVGGSDARATMRGGPDNSVIVEMEGRWTVVQIQLSLSVAADNDFLELYRIDGDAISDKPTIEARVLNDVASFVSLPSAASDVFFEEPVAVFSMDAHGALLADDGLGGAALAVDSGVASSVDDARASLGLAAAHVTSTPLFADLRFAVKLRGSGNALTVGQITRITVRGHPTGARAGLADSGPEPSPTVFFFQAPGEIQGSVSTPSVTPDSGVQFGDALQRYLDDLFQRVEAGETPAPAAGVPLPLSLVVESDAPCRVRFDPGGNTDGLSAPYEPLIDGFPGGEDKLVLRFSDSEGFEHEVGLAVPEGASVDSAILSVLPSFRQGRADPGTGPALEEPPSRTEGAFVADDRWVGKRIDAGSAVLARGLALGLAPLVEGTELFCEIQEDWQGSPSGKVLASGRLTTGPPGEGSWSLLTLPNPVQLPTEPHWILVTAAAGKAVWLADPASGNVPVFEKRDGGGRFQTRGTIKGLSPLHQFFVPASAGGSSVPLTVAVGEGEASVVPAPSSGLNGEPERSSIDLGADLTAYLNGPSAVAEAGVVPVPLVFRASLPGILTVYRPRIALS